MITSFDKPDFVSTGGHLVTPAGGKVTMPCHVNSLGGRQVLMVVF